MSASPPSARPRRPRRWHRLAIPFLVLGLLYLVTAVAHLVEEPDLGDPGTLSPDGSGPDGSDRLAGMLTAAGVEIHLVTSSREALAALSAVPDATVFVPTPNLLDPEFFFRAEQQPGGHRLVLVRPNGRTASRVGFLSSLPRWAARTVRPGCDTDFAVAAGPATVLRSRYRAIDGPAHINCYGGGLVGLAAGEREVLVVGATDPFRNSRIGEAGNAALATALLSRHRDLIWVDVHKAEPRRAASADLSLPEYRQPDRGARAQSVVLAALPPALWAVLGLLFAVALLTALVRARRLGPPVVEPLPAVVPATETVTGRGRLYARIGAREASLEALRSAALRRMAPVVSPLAAGGRRGVGLDEEFEFGLQRMLDGLALHLGTPPAERRP